MPINYSDLDVDVFTNGSSKIKQPSRSITLHPARYHGFLKTHTVLYISLNQETNVFK